MLLVCPSCETAFRIAAEALEPSGRNVRCARCKTIWFADPPRALQPAVPARTAELLAFPALAATASPPIAGDDIVVREPSAPDEHKPALESAEPAPAAVEASSESAAAEPSPAPAARPAWRSLPWRGKNSPRGTGPTLVAATAALGCIVTAGLVAPAALVQAMPDLAGLYTAAGVSVNVRGLEFRELRTTRETHDGVALLVTEGRVINVSGRELELPPIRLAALAANGRELYVWSATATRATLVDGGSTAFKSRLASPPVDAEQVQARFMTRGELGWADR
jgi:predicted Zn finger-like uncharacterized protein